MTKYLYLYLLLINLIGFLAMYIDKRKAIKNRWRIPEATLITVAVLGGSLGSITGMRLFRHKTRHSKFTWGLPIIFTIQVILAVIFVSSGLLPLF